MKKTITLLALLFSVFSFYAQDPNILWQRTIGGSEGDFLLASNKTSDGGFILGGFSESDISGDKTNASIGLTDFWIIKLDNVHNIEWQRTIGGFSDDRPYSISQTIDNGYIIGGISNSNISGDKSENCLGFTDYWVVKLDAFGAIEWENTIGAGDENIIDYEILESISQTSDGGYMLTGSSDNNTSGDKSEDSKGNVDFWSIKLSPTGIIEWEKTIGGSNFDAPHDIIQSNDDGFMLIGSSNSNISGDKTEDSRGSLDVWIIKLNSTFNIEWQKTIGGAGGDEGYRIKQTADGGYILGCNSNSDISGEKSENSYGDLDFWILKIDNVGNIEWQKTIGGNDREQIKSISQTNDGGYIIGGISKSNLSGNKTENSQGDEDFWLLKINNVGIIEWQNTIGGANFDGLYSLFQTNDNSFFLGGYSASNISGDKTENSRGEADFWIIKHAQTLSLEENPFNTAITLYPNPTTNTLQLNTQDKIINQINIYTMTGSKVLQLDVDSISPTLDVSSLASGVYYIQFYSGKNVALKKFVKN
ncbi:T9SS type A sorting domain-containing protein [Aequorivita marina]|uniref:T9SS type A sorting domain-containing protein n=1 Tax=Aequorivita marina TaxID=3073654 RepID=UPI0028762050|nr:T9SS type A sorting domain-containing protein [Aequorivita sp. S2608]MDS1298607.1 T9SS type A sorting domain-containing protein [Aequorivita sp. S2608]